MKRVLSGSNSLDHERMTGWEELMENYIVRIYRFQKDNPRQLVGIVESVEGEKREKRAFTNLDDLWAILNSRLSATVFAQQGRIAGGGASIYPDECPDGAGHDRNR